MKSRSIPVTCHMLLFFRGTDLTFSGVSKKPAGKEHLWLAEVFPSVAGAADPALNYCK